MGFKVIDLSQEIYQGMSVFPMHQPTFIMTNMTHEENMKRTGSKTLGFSARNLLISEHGGTHSDDVWDNCSQLRSGKKRSKAFSKLIGFNDRRTIRFSCHGNHNPENIHSVGYWTARRTYLHGVW